MNPFTTLTARSALLPLNDIDTDQIIPARFLKTTNKAGLGDNLFSDWRYNEDGSPKPDFILNKPEGRQASILFVGSNFGSGSSREHAPWALTGYGFKAVVGASFADIFRNNALKNGLLPVQLEPGAHQKLQSLLTNDPSAEITIDLASQTLTMPDGEKTSFPIDDFSKTCLLKGTDELGYILSFESQISAYENQ